MPMHLRTLEPNQDGLITDADNVIVAVQTRLRRITTLSLWQTRSAELMETLRGELNTAIGELANLHEEIAYWRANASVILGMDPPPQVYVDALRQPQTELYRSIRVPIDGEPWTIGLRRDRPTLDPLQIMQAWHEITQTAREVRGLEAQP